VGLIANWGREFTCEAVVDPLFSPVRSLSCSIFAKWIVHFSGRKNEPKTPWLESLGLASTFAPLSFRKLARFRSLRQAK
jgi:hypothetical protein